ncbi:MAG: hypothetical protein WCJ04_03660 [Actinomycetes bacterium]
MHSATNSSAHPPLEVALPARGKDQAESLRFREPWAALVVGAIATALRAIWVVLAARTPVGLSDPNLYLRAAASLAHGTGYTSLLGQPTAYYPPGYPVFVACVQRLAELLGQGSHLILILGLAQAVLGGVAAAALVIAGNRVRPGLRLGVIAGLLFALWPNLIIHSGLVLSESLFLCCFCVLLAALFIWTSRAQPVSGGGGDQLDFELSTEGTGADQQSSAHRHSLLVATVILATAACTLVRPQSAVLVVPAAGIAWWMTALGWRVALRGMGLLILGLMVAVVPWTLRNALVLKEFVPMSTNTGDNFCIGFHDAASGGFSITADCATKGNYTDGPRVEVARDHELQSRTLHWVADHPGSIPVLSVKKLQITLGHDADAVFAWESFGADPHLSDGARSALYWICNLYYWVVGVVSLFGAVMVVRRWWANRHEPSESAQVGNGLIALMTCVFGVLLPVMFFGDERFKIPFLPCVALLAAVVVRAALPARLPSNSEPEPQQRYESPASEPA